MATGNCPKTTLRKQQLQKPKAKEDRESKLGVSRLCSFPYGLFVQHSNANGEEEKEKKRKV